MKYRERELRSAEYFVVNNEEVTALQNFRLVFSLACNGVCKRLRITFKIASPSKASVIGVRSCQNASLKMELPIRCQSGKNQLLSNEIFSFDNTYYISH